MVTTIGSSEFRVSNIGQPKGSLHIIEEACRVQIVLLTVTLIYVDLRHIIIDSPQLQPTPLDQVLYDQLLLDLTMFCLPQLCQYALVMLST